MHQIFKKYNRIFLIEPNLVKELGHVVEFPNSLLKYLDYNKRVFLIANKKVQSNVRKRFPGVSGLISNTCFQNLGTNGSIFFEDLKKVNKIFSLNSNDIVIVMTSYWNELLGSEIYSQNCIFNSPKFIFCIHQFFPPEKEFRTTTDKEYVGSIKRKWGNVLSKLSNKFVITIPPVSTLKTEFQSLTSLNIECLPLPYDKYDYSKSQMLNDCKNISFLGDGRYEKGLLYLINSIGKHQRVKYLVQNLNARGYSGPEMKYLQKKFQNISKLQNVRLYPKPYTNEKLYEEIVNTDLMVLPYLPESYDKRASGIYIQAAQQGIPCVVADNTWLGEEVKKYGNGIVFKYGKTSNIESNTKIISEAIDIAVTKYKEIRANAIKAKADYLKVHNAKNFLDTLYNLISK